MKSERHSFGYKRRAKILDSFPEEKSLLLAGLNLGVLIEQTKWIG
jgi:hypothetical protein